MCDVSARSTTVLLQAASVLSDADIVAHAPFFQAKLEAARVAVAAIPAQPVTSAFLSITTPPAAELQKAIESTLGTLILSAPTEAAPVRTQPIEQANPTPAIPASRAETSAQQGASAAGGAAASLAGRLGGLD